MRVCGDVELFIFITRSDSGQGACSECQCQEADEYIRETHLDWSDRLESYCWFALKNLGVVKSRSLRMKSWQLSGFIHCQMLQTGRCRGFLTETISTHARDLTSSFQLLASVL